MTQLCPQLHKKNKAVGHDHQTNAYFPKTNQKKHHGQPTAIVLLEDTAKSGRHLHPNSTSHYKEVPMVHRNE